jgi:hypothetical protein
MPGSGRFTRNLPARGGIYIPDKEDRNLDLWYITVYVVGYSQARPKFIKAMHEAAAVEITSTVVNRCSEFFLPVKGIDRVPREQMDHLGEQLTFGSRHPQVYDYQMLMIEVPMNGSGQWRRGDHDERGDWTMSWMRNQLNPSFDAYLGVINRDHPLWGHDSSEWLSDPFNERKEALST